MKADDASDDALDDLKDKSIDSGPEDLQEAMNSTNFLPYISDRYET